MEHVIVNMSLSIEGHDLTVSNYSEYLDVVIDQGYGREGYPKRGDIRVELISPQDTVSVLLPYRDFDSYNNIGYISWAFMSVHHWGSTLSVNGSSLYTSGPRWGLCQQQYTA